MPSVRIWALESDYDERAIRCLAEKLVEHLKITVCVQSAGQSALSRLKQSEGGLRKAVVNYLKQDACVIFVLDHDSPAKQTELKRQRHSLRSKVEDILQQDEFAGRVYLVYAVQELEAWLLIDCLGIVCYFAQDRCHKMRLPLSECRARLSQDPKLKKVVRKHQAGDTSLIIEPFPGGPGAKETLVKFSLEALAVLNPKLKPSNLDEKCYREFLSPSIASFVEITPETLRRNDSLRQLGDAIHQCACNVK